MNKTNTVHIGWEIHKQTKLYCVENNLNIREYIENLISMDLKPKPELGQQVTPTFLQPPTDDVERELERLLSKV
jgi:hypothetical protein